MTPVRRYRSLASVYHPDKHSDPEMKERAAHSFTRIQAAYEVTLLTSCSLTLPLPHYCMRLTGGLA